MVSDFAEANARSLVESRMAAMLLHDRMRNGFFHNLLV